MLIRILRFEVRRYMARKVFEWCRQSYFGSETFARVAVTVPGVRDMSYNGTFNDLSIIVRGKPTTEWKEEQKGAVTGERLRAGGPSVMEGPRP